jgi:hypothetical protein
MEGNAEILQGHFHYVADHHPLIPTMPAHSWAGIVFIEKEIDSRQEFLFQIVGCGESARAPSL